MIGHKRKILRAIFTKIIPLLAIVVGALILLQPNLVGIVQTSYFDAPIAKFVLSGTLILTATVFLMLSRMVENDAFTATNFAVERQIERLADLLALAEKSVVIFSGELSHSVYEDDAIISGFERLPPNTRLHLFIENDIIDPKSVKFKELIERRGWNVQNTPFRAKHHFAVVDCRDLRIESRAIDNSKPQYARYLKARPDLARRVLGDFKRSILAFDPGYDNELLKF